MASKSKRNTVSVMIIQAQQLLQLKPNPTAEVLGKITAMTSYFSKKMIEITQNPKHPDKSSYKNIQHIWALLMDYRKPKVR